MVVPLDVVTEPTPDTEPMKAENIPALRQRLANVNEATRRQLGRVAEPQRAELTTGVYQVDALRLWTMFGYTTCTDTKAGIPN